MKQLLLAVSLLAFSLGSASAQDALYDWSGLYLGVHGGYGIGESDGIFDNVGNPGGPYDLSKLDLTGGIYGAHIGYNWQINHFVLGIEADVTGGSLKDKMLGTFSVPAPYIESQLDLLASVRGRAGYAFDNFLVYGTAGLGYAKYKFSSEFSGISVPFASVENSKFGGVIGGGIEYGHGHWVVGAEALHYAINPDHKFADIEIPDADLGDHVKWSGTTTFNLRVSYKF